MLVARAAPFSTEMATASRLLKVVRLAACKFKDAPIDAEISLPL
jgi:hypothetical protein